MKAVFVALTVLVVVFVLALAACTPLASPTGGTLTQPDAGISVDAGSDGASWHAPGDGHPVRDPAPTPSPECRPTATPTACDAVYPGAGLTAMECDAGVDLRTDPRYPDCYLGDGLTCCKLGGS